MLLGGAALAASAVLTSTSASGAATNTHSGEALPHTVVRWNTKTRQWAPRPPHAEFGVVFLSTNDPHATAPTDRHMQAGDVWRRHPDAEEHRPEGEYK